MLGFSEILLIYIDVDIKVGFEVNVSILFGLGVSFKALVNKTAEMLMNNSFVILTCVWCVVAFLRGLGGTPLIQTRDYHLKVLPTSSMRNAVRGSIPLPRTNLLTVINGIIGVEG